MDMSTRDTTQTYVWKVTLIITLVLSFFFLLPQLSVLILACLMAFIFYPLYLRLKRKNGWVAAIGTLVVSLLIVIVPLVVVTALTAAQLFQLADALTKTETTQSIIRFVDGTNAFFASVVAPLTGIHVDISTNGIGSFLRTSLPAIIRGFSQFILGAAGSIPGAVVGFIVYVFVFVELLVRGPKLVALAYDISPFTKRVTEQFLERIGLMANAMVKGQLIISMIFSAIAALLLIPLGYGEYAFILFIIFTILNFVPLGCGIIFFPLVIYSAITEAFWPAAIVVILYSLAGNLDTILRPVFIPKKIQLSTALTLVATFCGLAYFGLLGVVYGPIIMIVITTALTLYREQQGKRPA